MAKEKNELTDVSTPSSTAITAKAEPKEMDIYSPEMLKELEKRNKAIKTALNGIEKNFEKTAFNLYWIYQTGMYKVMGFDSIVDYASSEFDFSKSSTYGFISIVERFGKRDKDGKIQDSIDDRYKDYSSSKLSIMTNLEDAEIESSGIVPEMSVRDIKKAVKCTLGSAGTQSKTKNEPSDSDIIAFYEYKASEYDNDRNQLAELLKEGCRYLGYGSDDLSFQCSSRGIKFDGCEEITWARYVKRLNGLIPVQPASVQPEPEPDTTGKPDDNWIPYSGLPPLKDFEEQIQKDFLVTTMHGSVTLMCFDFEDNTFYLNGFEGDVLAWQPLPKPYKQEGEI